MVAGNDQGCGGAFGNVIYRYTRKQAIDDGVLVDISEIAVEAGFKWSVAMTDTVWNEVMIPTDLERSMFGQSEAGRLWDVFSVLRFGIRRTQEPTDTLLFTVAIMREDDGLVEVPLKCLIGPGDHGEPVLTIMYPHED